MLAAGTKLGSLEGWLAGVVRRPSGALRCPRGGDAGLLGLTVARLWLGLVLARAGVVSGFVTVRGRNLVGTSTDARFALSRGDRRPLPSSEAVWGAWVVFLVKRTRSSRAPIAGFVILATHAVGRGW